MIASKDEMEGGMRDGNKSKALEPFWKRVPLINQIR